MCIVQYDDFGNNQSQAMERARARVCTHTHIRIWYKVEHDDFWENFALAKERVRTHAHTHTYTHAHTHTHTQVNTASTGIPCAAANWTLPQLQFLNRQRDSQMTTKMTIELTFENFCLHCSRVGIAIVGTILKCQLHSHFLWSLE